MNENYNTQVHYTGKTGSDIPKTSGSLKCSICGLYYDSEIFYVNNIIYCSECYINHKYGEGDSLCQN